MIIERQDQDIIIRLDGTLLALEDVQKVTDYVRFLESTAKNQGTEAQAAALARSVEKTWWAQNRSRFLP